jgi:hypothetical protein
MNQHIKVVDLSQSRRFLRAFRGLGIDSRCGLAISAADRILWGGKEPYLGVWGGSRSRSLSLDF